MSITASPTDDTASPGRPPSDREIDETVLPAESEDTAYSIDLDALLLGGGSKNGDGGDLTLDDDTEPFDTVRSEDIDGPSDFTQNMEFWMRARLPQGSGGKKRSASANTAASRRAREGEEVVEEEEEEEEDGEEQDVNNTLPLAPAPLRPSAPPSFDSRDHVSDSEGGEEEEEDDDDDDDDEGRGAAAAGSEHGSYEYTQSDHGEDTREMAAAAMQDLHGYVISDEDTFMPPRDSRRGSSTIGDDDERGSRQGSIDEQIDILSSMDDVNEEEYRSVSASPAPRQDERKRDTSAPSRASWLQPTVEDHEDTPPPLSNRPSPRGGGGARAPEVRIEDYEDHLRKMNEAARKSAALDVRDSASASRTTPSSSKNDADADTDADPDDLRAQLNRLRNELARQKDDSASRISNLEQQLHRAHAERDEARSNEQRRVRDLTARHDERARDLDDHWQRRLAAQQARAEHDAQEQASAFALVRSSFDARLAASETALLARLAQKDAELDTARTAHAQELEQLRAGHDARVASLEARVGDLQAARADRRSGGGDDQHLGGRDSSLPVTVEQTLAQQKADARIAELEARLAAAQAHLEAARAEQSLSSSFSYSDAGKGLGGRVGGNSTKHHHQAEDELLERSRRQVEDLETSLELLREQLGFARRETEGLRRDADAARESARVLRDELREAQARAAEGERRAGGLERAREEDGEMAEAARRDVVRMLENARREADAERARARELEKLVERMKGEKDGVRKRAEEAVRVAGTRLNGERIEKAGLKRALEGLKAEVEELRGTVEARKKGFEDVEGREGGAAFERMGNEHTDTFSSPDSRSSELESLRRALREAGLAAKDAQADARKARAEMAALKEDFESVNRAMDERVVQLLRTREKEWRQKVEALEKEKKALGRALLHEWGREEVGECEPQAYRYKFVKKGGAGEKGKV